MPDNNNPFTTKIDLSIPWLNEGDPNDSIFKPINLWNPTGTSTPTTAPFKTSMKLPTANLAGVSQTERDRRARQAQQGFWGNMWDNMTDYVQNNPYEAIGGALNVAGGLWTGYQNYKNQKNQLALAREQLALQQQAYNDSNARAQEAWNLQKRQLRSSSL